MFRFTQLCVEAVVLAALLCECTGAALAPETTPTLWKLTDVNERIEQGRGGHYADRMREIFNEKVTTNGIVFLGDSITDYSNLNELFEGYHGKPVFNHGIGGDTIDGLMERLDVCVQRFEPSEIFVMIGTNDIFNNSDYKNGQLGEAYRLLFRTLKEMAPQAKITAFTVPPVNKDMNITGHVPEDIITANKQLLDVCAAEKIPYIDTYKLFVNDNGEFKKGMTLDGCHPVCFGYLTWFEKLAATPDERFAMWQNVAGKPYWPEYNSIPIDGINSPRDDNMLVIYQREQGTTVSRTGTTTGREAVVRDGKAALSGPNTIIPAKPDYLISVMDSYRTHWFACNILNGTEVRIDDGGKTLTMVHRAAEGDKEEDYTVLRRAVLTELKDAQTSKTVDALKAISANLSADKAMSRKDFEKTLSEIKKIGEGK